MSHKFKEVLDKLCIYEQTDYLQTRSQGHKGPAFATKSHAYMTKGHRHRHRHCHSEEINKEPGDEQVGFVPP